MPSREPCSETTTVSRALDKNSFWGWRRLGLHEGSFYHTQLGRAVPIPALREQHLRRRYFIHMVYSGVNCVYSGPSGPLGSY
jgi:hypothetical protein